MDVTVNNESVIYSGSEGRSLSNSTIRSVIVFDGVKEVKEGSFSQCYNLTSITFPTSLVRISDFAYSSCQSLTTIDLSSSSLSSLGSGVFQGCHSLVGAFLPSTVGRIGPRAFANCSSLRSIRIPDKVKEIETELFFGCARLEDVMLPLSLRSIERGAFSGSALREVQVRDVKFVGDFAFANSPRLETVEFGVEIGVGRGCLSNCPKLKNLFLVAGETARIGASERCLALQARGVPETQAQHLASLADGIPAIMQTMLQTMQAAQAAVAELGPTAPVGELLAAAQAQQTQTPPHATIPTFSPILSPSSKTTISFLLHQEPSEMLLSDFAHPDYSSCTFGVVPTISSAWFFHPTFNHVSFRKFYPSPSLRSRRGRSHTSLSSHVRPSYEERCREYWEDTVRLVEVKTTRDVGRVVMGYLMDEQGVKMFYGVVWGTREKKERKKKKERKEKKERK